MTTATGSNQRVDRTRPSTGVRTSSHRRTGLATFALVLAVGGITSCDAWQLPKNVGRDGSSDSNLAAAALDPQVTAYDADAHGYWFDGRGGSLIIDDGWSPTESWRGETFAWIEGRSASLWFSQERPGRAGVFRAVCRAMKYEGVPEQELSLSVNGTQVGKAVVAASWHEVTIAIPAEVTIRGLNRLRLDLAWTAKPADVGINNDRRNLSACFRWISVAEPVAGPAPEAEKRGATFDRDRKVLALEQRDQVEIPIPARTRFGLSLQASPATHHPFDLEVRFVDEDGEVEAWLGTVASDKVRDVVFENDHDSSATLCMRMGPSGNLRGGQDAVELKWGPGQVWIERLAHQGDPRPPNVFIYVVDTLRVDALQLYGGPRATSPALQRFAEDAVVYERAVAASTWTLPSVVSIMTGVYPSRHGIMRGDLKLTAASPFPTLASLFDDAGYETVGISQSYVAGPKFGIDTGFRTFMLNNQLNGKTLRSEEVRRSLTQWLGTFQYGARPVFAYIHTVGPHAPYTPTGRFKSFADDSPGNLAEGDYLPALFVSEGYGQDATERDHLRALYDGEVQYADDRFGQFLNILRFFDLYENSIVIFVSDHGEEFFDHGAFDHGRTVFDEVARVPLIIKYPARFSIGPTRERRRVSTLDIFPTVMSAAGLDMKGLVVDGHDLGPTEVALDNAPPTVRTVFSELDVRANEIYGGVELQAAWFGDLKCVENLGGVDQFGGPQPGLFGFDLASDPLELDPFQAGNPRMEACRQVLFTRNARGLGLRAGEFRAEPAVSEETADMLRALGYIR